MRSLHPLQITTTIGKPLAFSAPGPFARTVLQEGSSYGLRRRRRATAFWVTLNEEMVGQENATEFESLVMTKLIDVESDGLVVEMEDRSEKESKDAAPSSRVSFRVPTNENDEDSSTLPFLGMTPSAILALNLVAVIWGTQHAVIKLIVDASDDLAGPFTLLRFAIGAVIASVPLLKKSPAEDDNKDLGTEERTNLLDGAASDVAQQQSTAEEKVWRWGAEMGFWMFLGFAFQAIGLATTTAQRSGFLLYLNVKFVPFFALLLFGRRISIPTLVSAFTAFGGTALLAYDGTSWSLNQGDLWTIAAAAASAMYILRLDTAAKEVGDSRSIELNAACLWVVTLASVFWSVGTTEDVSRLGQQLMGIATTHPLELFYLSAVTTALANYIQTKSQKEISAERASVIYAMDPVYGAIFSYLLLGETLSGLGMVGAGLITVAAGTNALLDLGGTSEGGSEVRKSQ